MNSSNNFFQSKTFKGILYGIGIFVLALIIFQLGVFVGFKKASFSYRWGDNYYRNFAGSNPDFIRDFQGRYFLNAHGVSGTILKIDGQNLVLKGDVDGTEKIVTTDQNTIINRFRDRISFNDLKVNDNVVVIGSPNNSGQIEAKLIRVVPFVMSGMMPMMNAQFLTQTQQ